MRRLILRSLIELLRYDFFLRKHDFFALYKQVRNIPVARHTPSPNDIETICTAVAHACMWYPKHALCLQRSTVATVLLRQHGIAAELTIGAQRLPLKSHAWVEVDGRVVNDKPEVQAEYLILDRC
ncbi:lasso peptide biosynthesis B2 protein [Granulicella sp. L60]|uniref:lasso peptide biosynthesis B2 protein n=1 Tax=Granulicella sp. L60 TaxID=1641866 RepID=UPI00131CDCFB